MSFSSSMIVQSYDRYGAPEMVKPKHVPIPEPHDAQVRIRVVATTVSSGDWRARSLSFPKGFGLIGRLFFGISGPRQGVLGTELSGVVDAVGADETRFAVGDPVIAFPGARFGAHAEYIVMPETSAIVAKPATLDFDHAAALAFGGTAALDFLRNKAGLQAGDHVVINGASGAVGVAAVQIAHHLGARVTAVAGARNADLLRGLGADHVIDYRQQDFAAAGAQYDMVIDTVGSAPWSRTRHALKPGGRMVMISGSLWDMLTGALRAKLRGKRLVAGVASESPELLQDVVGLAEAGALRAVIDRSYGFEDIVSAHHHVDAGHKTGSVLVRVSEAGIAARAA